VVYVRQKFHQNRIKIEAVKVRTRGQKDSSTSSDFIICPMLCYNNGTDKNCYEDAAHYNIIIL